MSTLKATNLQHPSAASPNVVMGSTGSVAVAGALTGAGMDLINKTDFSAVSSVSLNNVFTSAYENYRVIVSDVFASGGGVNGYMKFRTGGVDNSSASYRWQAIYRNDAGTLSGTGTTAGTEINMFTIASSQVSAAAIDVLNPQVAKHTVYSGVNRSFDNLWTIGGSFANTTQFDGLTFFPGSGTFTGTIRVYGLRNS